jgi:hypothetical protein
VTGQLLILVLHHHHRCLDHAIEFVAAEFRSFSGERTLGCVFWQFGQILSTADHPSEKVWFQCTARGVAQIAQPARRVVAREKRTAIRLRAAPHAGPVRIGKALGFGVRFCQHLRAGRDPLVRASRLLQLCQRLHQRQPRVVARHSQMIRTAAAPQLNRRQPGHPHRQQRNQHQ